MKALRLLPAAGLMVAAVALALATPAHADDCSQQLQSIQDLGKAASVQDCMRTGQTYGVAVGVVVGTAGVVIAVVGLPGRTPVPPPRPAVPQQPPAARREPEPQPQRHADPCFDQQTRYTVARTTARTAFNTLQTLRTERAYLDGLWEDTRQTGYLNAVVDVAMMAGSLWTKPAGTFATKLAERTLAQGAVKGMTKEILLPKIAETLMKAVGKELAKDLVRHLEDQNIDWSDLVGKAGEARLSSVAKDLIKDQLTQLEYDRQLSALTGTGGLPDRDLISKFTSPVVETVDKLFSVGKLGASALKAHEKLDEIRKAISSVDDHITQMDEIWRNEVDETDLAQDSLNRCRDLHGPAPS